MGLANGKVNKFFTPAKESENRYFIKDFDAEQTKGQNNVFMLVQNIPENSVVLDIGCAQGNFGQELKKKNCICYGIEIDEKAAAYSKKTGCYKDIFVMDMTKEDTPEYQRFLKVATNVNVIIFSDVFEHLVDPTTVLCQYAHLLEEGGIILVSVPNVAHMDIIMNLMNGKFNYTDMGILDNTHLKFFTKSSFVEWIDQINRTFADIKFDCEYLGATFYNSEYIENKKNDYAEFFSILEQCENFNGLQILFKLKKLSVSDEAINIENLVIEPHKDIVTLIGRTFKSIFDNSDNPKIVEGERLWYEIQLQQLKGGIAWHQKNDIESKQYIQKLENRLKELEDGIAWHQKNDIECKQYIQKLENRLKELEDGIAWHQKNDIESKQYIQKLENRLKELEDGIAWHQKNGIESKRYTQELENRLKELENGIMWHQKNDEELRRNNDYLEEKIKSSENRNNLLSANIYRMETSFSWKITKWLRKNSKEETK